MSRFSKPQPRELPDPKAAEAFISRGKSSLAPVPTAPTPTAAEGAKRSRSRSAATEVVTFRLSPEHKARLEAIAEHEDRSVQKILARILVPMIESYELPE